ncbi:hypothetical protein SKAU_G00098800 [Synaphobranchus kaupii]|uniref:Uncharacterized protein n=1 Tax=Synaphobranchus kaupii TaxID=118154 RepID=A0A9Q1FYD3_SYNKA|nr:hypothetical protein SKAU_G00098800 [Synaphobranchus kaupii]
MADLFKRGLPSLADTGIIARRLAHCPQTRRRGIWSSPTPSPPTPRPDQMNDLHSAKRHQPRLLPTPYLLQKPVRPAHELSPGVTRLRRSPVFPSPAGRRRHRGDAVTV